MKWMGASNKATMRPSPTATALRLWLLLSDAFIDVPVIDIVPPGRGVGLPRDCDREGLRRLGSYPIVTA